MDNSKGQCHGDIIIQELKGPDNFLSLEFSCLGVWLLTFLLQGLPPTHPYLSPSPKQLFVFVFFLKSLRH